MDRIAHDFERCPCGSVSVHAECLNTDWDIFLLQMKLDETKVKAYDAIVKARTKGDE